MDRPDIGFGMRHIALFVRDMSACEQFYVELMGMEVEWRPDDRNIYLTSGGRDNIALHQTNPDRPRDESDQRLDHLGFFVASPTSVDDWYRWLREHGIRVRNAPKDHRDGARSFYCYDPDGTLIRVIYHPPVARWEQLRCFE